MIRMAPPLPTDAKTIMPPPPPPDDASVVVNDGMVQGGILDVQRPNEQLATPEAVQPALQEKLKVPPLAVFAPPVEDTLPVAPKAPPSLKFTEQGLPMHAFPDKV